ncbi:hypothetical protein [Actinopolyspora lacussalsi]|nr:hypothetical protein [Actinopolyspora righensis]
MRPFPTPAEYGKWDVLPEDPPESELDLSNEDVTDALVRRERLKDEWRGYWHYPHGEHDPATAGETPETAEAWRNWLLRRSYQGIAFINGCVVRWSADSRARTRSERPVGSPATHAAASCGSIRPSRGRVMPALPPAGHT